ncbi:MAG: methyltransferase domain-containing protein [Candidatus Fermentibacteraceae bacterium]
MAGSSDKGHWDRFWSRPRRLDDIYDNDDRICIEATRRFAVTGLRTLEVGAATARDSASLAINGAVAVALDYSHRALARASEAGGGVMLVCGDAEALPFRDGVFDLVFHQGVMEHFRNPDPMTRECARVTAPGGALLVDVPQTFHPYTIVKKTLMVLGVWFAGWETQYTARGLRGFLASHGLVPESSYARYFSPSLAYRLLREVMLRLGARIPLRPILIPPVHRLRRRVRSTVENSALGLLTGCVIGVFARKPRT